MLSTKRIILGDVVAINDGASQVVSCLCESALSRYYPKRWDGRVINRSTFQAWARVVSLTPRHELAVVDFFRSLELVHVFDFVNCKLCLLISDKVVVFSIGSLVWVLPVSTQSWARSIICELPKDPQSFNSWYEPPDAAHPAAVHLPVN